MRSGDPVGQIGLYQAMGARGRQLNKVLASSGFTVCTHKIGSDHARWDIRYAPRSGAKADIIGCRRSANERHSLPRSKILTQLAPPVAAARGRRAIFAQPRRRGLQSDRQQIPSSSILIKPPVTVLSKSV